METAASSSSVWLFTVMVLAAPCQAVMVLAAPCQGNARSLEQKLVARMVTGTEMETAASSSCDGPGSPMSR
ncbi:hypothetical protein RRG08_062447 [Elysia crispata]|uniref:Uncharacterized protein n=1 Tax=Elysia crispata TaxID=231223 RepID=A0AAE1CJL9_9GAST|nr:hypothetical protein RRG08_062447 [Elysia crispata]